MGDRIAAPSLLNRICAVSRTGEGGSIDLGIGHYGVFAAACAA